MKSPNFFSITIMGAAWFCFLPPFSGYSENPLTAKVVGPVDKTARVAFPLASGAISLPAVRVELPKIFVPSYPRTNYMSYQWKNDILTTVFWVGEKPTRNNPVPNTASSWDTKWTSSFGGFDDPDPQSRDGWLPKGFIPRQNPFYFALPYNDIDGQKTKESSRINVPWFKEAFYREGKSVARGRWIAIRRGDKVCYGQWEDCGPFETDNWEYVFGNERPRTSGNGGAGLDVSPAIRDYLEFRYSTTCDWRFVEWYEVPDGPWKTWGNNNPFALRPKDNVSTANASESISKLRELREILVNPEKAKSLQAPAEVESTEILNP
jgi:hypothetical protein